jgi:hypothetical protein
MELSMITFSSDGLTWIAAATVSGFAALFSCWLAPSAEQIDAITLRQQILREPFFDFII